MFQPISCSPGNTFPKYARISRHAETYLNDLQICNKWVKDDSKLARSYDAHKGEELAINGHLEG